MINWIIFKFKRIVATILCVSLALNMLSPAFSEEIQKTQDSEPKIVEQLEKDQGNEKVEEFFDENNTEESTFKSFDTTKEEKLLIIKETKNDDTTKEIKIKINELNEVAEEESDNKNLEYTSEETNSFNDEKENKTKEINVDNEMIIDEIIELNLNEMENECYVYEDIDLNNTTNATISVGKILIDSEKNGLKNKENIASLSEYSENIYQKIIPISSSNNTDKIICATLSTSLFGLGTGTPWMYWYLTDGGTTINYSSIDPGGANPISGDGKITYTGLNKNNITRANFVNNIVAETCNGWFEDFNKLSTISNLEKLDTTLVKDMSNMFRYCGNYNSVFNLKQLNTENVENMSAMFLGY